MKRVTIFLLLTAALLAHADTPAITPLRAYLGLVGDRIAASMVYPEESRNAREQGACVIRLAIRPDGFVISAEVLESSGSSRLDKACVDTFSSVWRLPPFPSELEIAHDQFVALVPMKFGQPDGSDTVAVGDVIPVLPSYYQQVQNQISKNAAYPADSVTAREQGVCRVGIKIRRDGSLMIVEIIKSTGFKRLDAACLRAANDSKFPPVPESLSPEYSEFYFDAPITFML